MRHAKAPLSAPRSSSVIAVFLFRSCTIEEQVLIAMIAVILIES